MTSIGSAKADQLEALVHTIENATSLQTRLVIRNSEAWIASATHQIIATPTIDDAAKRALADALKFGERLPNAAVESSVIAANGTTGALPAVMSDGEEIEALRLAALSSLRAFQSSLLDAAQGESRLSLHC